MIKSMTGYGGAKGTSGQLGISIEVKSVNNRYLDCTIKIPRVYTALEEPLKSVVQQHISRGKVDVFIMIDTSNADDVEIKMNLPLIEAYIKALKDMSEHFEISCDLSVIDVTRFSDVLRAEKRETDNEQLLTDISAILKDALSEFNKMRNREGKKLHTDFIERLNKIEKLTSQVEEISPKSVAEYRVKLETRMQEVLQTANIDEARILTEAAIFADRVAINEETVRLRSHIAQLREMLDASEPVGRKIDFLIQEFNREANTIGSKGNDTDISRVVVEMKSEIEKIREQAQNVE